MANITQNLTLDGITDGDLLGNPFTWSGFPPFIAGYANDDGAAGTTTVNLSATGDWFAYGVEVNSSALQDLVFNFTDTAGGPVRYIGQLRIHEGTHTINLTHTGVETLMAFDDSDYDITLNVYSHLVRLRAGETNTTTINIGDGGAGTLDLEAGTNNITTGSGSVNFIRAGRFGETGTNTFVGGSGTVQNMSLSGTTHDITVGTGDLRTLKINEGSLATITANSTGEIDVLQSFADTTVLTASAALRSVELGEGNDVVTASGGIAQIILGNGNDTLNVSAQVARTVLAYSGDDVLNLTGTGRVYTAHLGLGDNTFDLSDSARAQAIGAWNNADTLNVSGSAILEAADLNGGDNIINQSGGWIGVVRMGNENDEINISGGRLKAVYADSGDNLLNVSGTGDVGSFIGDEGVDLVTVTDGGRIRTVQAGDGDNRITLGAEFTAFVETGDNKDYVATGTGYVRTVTTGDDDDRVFVGDGGAGSVQTGFGSDRVVTGAGFVTSITTSAGSSQTDLVDYVTVGSGGAGYIWTGDGDDRIYAYTGNVDFVAGGSGNEKLFMGDVFVGVAFMGAGNDYLRINQSTSDGGGRFSGGGDTDTMDFRSTTAAINVSLDLAGEFQNIGNVADTSDFTVASLGFFSITSMERLVGTAFDDVLEGNEDNNGSDGANRLTGLGGNDTLSGLGGDDQLYGGSGDDLIVGGTGNDYMVGNRDNDTLSGGDGNDILFGSSGSDIFVFEDSANMGFDRIRDWANNWDQLDLVDFGFASFADVSALAVDTGSDMRINLGAGNVIYIDNFQIAQFDATDVILV